MYQALLRHFVDARNSKLFKTGKLGPPIDASVLEDRVLFSASPQEGSVEISSEDVLYVTADGSDGDLLASLDSDWRELESQFLEFAELDSLEMGLVFIDERVEYSELILDLLNSGNSTFEIVILDDGKDGIGQITDALEQFKYASVNSVQIVSHGSSGSVQLGETMLTLENIDGFSSPIASWGDYLTEDADLLLLGCNVASGSLGEQFVDALHALTHADVAASDDLTGAAVRGGDWDLEYQTGTIESAIAFSQDAQKSWSGVLDSVVVDTTADIVDGNVNSIQDLQADRGDDGRISLREAIIAANADVGSDEIYFDITDPLIGDVHTIMVLSELPEITRQVLIDATTDADYANSPIVMLDGSLAGSSTDGLTIAGSLASGSTIRGLGIIRFDGHGVVIEDSDFNRIENNYVGVDVTGAIDLGNNESGILIDNGSSNTIGGTIYQGNVISGNDMHGVSIDGSAGVALGNVVSGNVIGTDADGTYAIGNEMHGINVEGGAFDTLIGGNDSTSKNIISGNLGSGIQLDSATETQILGNLIGTDGTGFSPIGNGASDEGGIRIVGNVTDSLIGSPDAPNVIAYAAGAGVVVEKNSSFGNEIRGNSFWGNSGLAIDLKDDGPTVNDDGDGDTGQNQLQNYPIDLSSSVNVDGELSVSAVLRSGALETYTLDFYATSAGGAVNDAERHIGSGAVSTVSGNFWFEYIDLDSDVFAGESVRMTATDSSGNTSEMSSGVIVGLSSSEPTATDDVVTLFSGEPEAIDVASNDSDPNGDSIYVLEYAQGSDGTVSQIGGTELLEYTSAAGFVGSDSFQYRIGDSADGIVHYWGFNGDAADLVGVLDGIVNGTPVTTAGEFADAYWFDEVDDYVEIADFDYSVSFTVSLAFMIDDISPGSPGSSIYLYSHGSEAVANSLNISVGELGSGSAGMLTTALRDSVDAMPTNALDIDISSLIGDGQWHDYTLTVEAGRGASVYVDGVLFAFSEDAGNAFDPNSNLFLGARDDLSGNEFYGGGLDSVRIHDRALTTVEISDMADGGESTGLVSLTVTDSAPKITSADSTIVAENTSFVHQLTFIDPVGLTSTLSITGGEDAALFEVDGANNLLFLAAPDFELSMDFDGNNEYLVEITAENVDGASSQLISIVIDDANEVPFAVDDVYDVIAGSVLATSAEDGVLSNDSDPDAGAAGLLGSENIGFDAATDINGDLIWQSEAGPAGFEWDFTSGGVTYNDNPAGAPAGIGSAWGFDGTGGGTMQSLLALPGPTPANAASFEFWIKPTDTTDRDVIFEIGTRLVGMSIVLDGDELQFHTDGGVFADHTLTYSGPEIVLGEYVHIVAVVDPTGAIAGGAGADLQLFVNGELVDSATDLPLTFDVWSSGMDDAGLGQSVGLMSAPAGSFFEGEIAMFRFFEASLTQEDVAQQYSAVVDQLKVTSLNGQTVAIAEWLGLTSGAMVRLNSDGSFDYDENGAFEYLAEGEVAADTVIYEVSDPEGLSGSAQITFSVVGINEQPIAIGLDNDTLSENVVGGAVGTLTVDDPDTGDTHTWQVNDVRFEVTPLGVLKLVDGVAIDFETEETVELELTAADPAGSSYVETFIIGILDENDAPTSIAMDNLTVSENSAGAAVGGVTVVDPDLGDAHVVTVDDVRFEVVGGFLRLKPGESLDFESEPFATIELTATDGGGLSHQQEFTITVENENDLPTDISISNDLVAENSNTTLGLEIGSLSTADQDSGESFTYSIVGGVDEANFSLVGNRLFLDDGILDYETKSQYEVFIRSTDSGGAEVAELVTINVDDINESPQITNSITAFTLPENSLFVTTVQATDPEGEPLSFEIVGGPDAAFFTINTLSGVLTFVDPADFDALADRDHDNVYKVDVKAFDPEINIDVQRFTIELTPTNDNAPVFESKSFFGVQSGIKYVGHVQAGDADLPNDFITYSIAGGLHMGQFSIDRDTGKLEFTNAQMHNAVGNNFRRVIVAADDGAGLTTYQTITVEVKNAPPVAIDDLFDVSNVEILEDSVLNGDFDIDDRNLSLAVVSGPSNGSLTLNPNGTFSYTPNADYSGTDEFVYQIEDEAGNTDTATATIHVVATGGPLPSGGGGDGSSSSTSTPSSGADPNSTTQPEDVQGSAGTIDPTGALAGDYGVTSSNRLKSEHTFSNELLSAMLNDVDDELRSVASTLTPPEFSPAEHGYGDRNNMWALRADSASRFDYGAETLSVAGAFFDYLPETVMEAHSMDGVEDTEFSGEFADNVLHASMVTVSGVVLGYVVWVVQSGMALSNVMTQLPSWKSFDPLPVLQFADHSPEGDDESLEDFIRRHQSKLPKT